MKGILDWSFPDLSPIFSDLSPIFRVALGASSHPAQALASPIPDFYGGCLTVESRFPIAWKLFHNLVLKGHGFSRAAEGAKGSGALAPEGNLESGEVGYETASGDFFFCSRLTCPILSVFLRKGWEINDI